VPARTSPASVNSTAVPLTAAPTTLTFAWPAPSPPSAVDVAWRAMRRKVSTSFTVTPSNTEVATLCARPSARAIVVRVVADVTVTPGRGSAATATASALASGPFSSRVARIVPTVGPCPGTTDAS
jgi:hypothetical protein